MINYTSCLIMCALLTVLNNAVATRDTCIDYYQAVINNYFRRTALHSSQTDCNDARRHPRDIEHWLMPVIDIDQVIQLYKLLPNVDLYQNLDEHDPVTNYGAIQIKGNMIPIFVVADIRRQHLTDTDSSICFGLDAINQMELMGIRETDEIGHIVARCIGGSNKVINLIPIANNVLILRDTGFNEGTQQPDIPASSAWQANSAWIRRFLFSYPNGRVVRSVALHYPDDMATNPERHDSYRPDSFTVQYIAYTNQYDNSSVYYESPQLTYVNEDTYVCQRPMRRYYMRRRRSLSQDMQSTCPIRMPVKPRGVMGEETSHGEWNTRHQVSFPFTIGGKQYFYGQSIIDGHHWFIQELLPDGRMGAETDHGAWNEDYLVQFPFFINGRQFFFGHSPARRTWFIQELLPGGKMGEETSHGDSASSHKVCFPYTIAGRHYFYCQSIIDGHHWFIQELLPGGKAGEEITCGSWTYDYPVAFPFSINGRHYFYGYSPERYNWFIQELLPNGQMGEEKSHGSWNTRHQACFPYAIGHKHYFYCQSILDGTHWFIQELLPNGQMGVETSHGRWNENYPVVFPFMINGKHYFYGHSTEIDTWFIQLLL